MLRFIDNYETVRQITTIIFCAGTILTSCEYLAVRKEFRDEGFYSWKILSSRPEYLNSPLFIRMPWLFGYRGFLIIQFLTITCCILLPIQNSGKGAALAISLIAIGSLLMSFRNIVGCDGADQMNRVVCLALWLMYCSRDPFITKVVLFFIASQGLMSYTVAGIAKGFSTKWRSGVAIREIMNTETYGDYTVAHLLSGTPKTLNRALCWSIILFEAFFFLAVVVPTPFCVILLIAACGFHLMNAAVMGLNNFVWAFVATFPSVLFVNHLIARHLWS